jgi:sugar lactone lactonase YvrE
VTGTPGGDTVGPVRDIEVDGLCFPEGPRWRDGRWWISDQLGNRVLTVRPDGQWSILADIQRPSGLGFQPDGTLWVATMTKPSVVAVTGTDVQRVVDLSGMAVTLNDMVVDPRGLAYLDAYGERMDAECHLIAVVPGEEPRVVAGGLAFPNGLIVTPDGATLLVAETFAARITAFEIGSDGALSNRRTWASIEGSSPDGICLCADGTVWVSSFERGEFLRVREGGEVVERVALGDGRWAMACSLGGDDGRSLLLCTARTTLAAYVAGNATGRLGLVDVTVPGVGCP